MRPDKSLGQHFLTDVHTARTVVTEGELGKGTEVVEVGPGQGFLTRYLLDSGANVLAIEKDGRMVEHLTKLFSGRSLKIVSSDFLDTDLEMVCPSGSVRVGNLPYNASVAILEKALYQRERFSRLVLMFQLEVARRVCAQAGGEWYGIPSVVTAVSHRASIVRRIPPGAFFPAPKVQSAVVRFDPLASPLLDSGRTRSFIDLVASAFRFRRKTILNSLVRGTGFSADRILSALEVAGIEPGCRIEQVGVEKLVELWKVLK